MLAEVDGPGIIRSLLLQFPAWPYDYEAGGQRERSDGLPLAALRKHREAGDLLPARGLPTGPALGWPENPPILPLFLPLNALALIVLDT